jgi:hypothetical protein
MKFLQIAMFLRLRTRGFLVRVKNPRVANRGIHAYSGP